ncbi:MAG: hypothetical protein J6C38_01410 [Oscillospiraceae bacterium]|nr:hypothetical protein [Oscillospiraceae bacterium]
MAYLGDKAVGDIVKIKEDGTAVNYIIVHKGKPSEMYDDSCDGVWVLREKTHSQRAWHGTSSSTSSNDYENSSIESWLNGDFLNTIDEKIREAIKTVIIPYRKGSGTSMTVQSRVNGLSCKAFLLSGYEVGFTRSNNQYLPIDGAKLSYFSDINSRIGKNSTDTAVDWWLRSPNTRDDASGFFSLTNGSLGGSNTFYSSVAARPAFILPTSLSVDDDGNVSANNPPTITADKTGDIGTLDSGFSCNYSVDDADESDSVSVTLDLDGTQISTFTATKNQQETYTLGGDDWLKVTNGEHTFTISASDGKDTATSTIIFTRNLTELTVTLAQPFPADDVISACALNVEGSIPADAVCKYEVTNNALDTEPVWEDCTKKSQAGFSYVFTNKTAENGFAFNFRVTISRGESGSGGYITSISGGFE